MRPEEARRYVEQLRIRDHRGRTEPIPSHIVDVVAPLIVTLTRQERVRCLGAIRNFGTGAACRTAIESLDD